MLDFTENYFLLGHCQDLKPTAANRIFKVVLHRFGSGRLEIKVFYDFLQKFQQHSPAN